jgi:hypothetical protein
MSNQRSGRGVGSLVIAIYGVFALSATVRALFQLVTKYDEAPLAYWLSLLAGLVYVVATYALATNNFRIAKITLFFELTVVITVGATSLIAPEVFADHTVWSSFGVDYGFIPLALPIFGLWWISGRKL